VNTTLQFSETPVEAQDEFEWAQSSPTPNQSNYSSQNGSNDSFGNDLDLEFINDDDNFLFASDLFQNSTDSAFDGSNFETLKEESINNNNNVGSGRKRKSRQS